MNQENGTPNDLLDSGPVPHCSGGVRDSSVPALGPRPAIGQSTPQETDPTHSNTANSDSPPPPTMPSRPPTAGADDGNETLTDIPYAPPQSPPSYDECGAIQLPADEVLEPPQATDKPAPKPLFFTTTDRLLDTLRNRAAEWLNKKPIYYAEELAKTEHQRLVTVSGSPDYLTLDSTVQLPNGQTVKTYYGLVVPRVAVQIPDKLYHFCIKIKSPLPAIGATSAKHMFYAYEDEELLPEDQSSLILNTAAIKEAVSHCKTAEEEYLAQTITGSIPQVVNSVNLVSEETRTVVRAELIEPVLTSAELAAFEDPEIQARVAKHISTIQQQDPDANVSNVRTPTTLECLSTLYRVLKGPLENRASPYHKTLKPGNSPLLKLHLNLELLTQKLFFRKIDEDGHLELEPPFFQDLGDNRTLCEQYYVRALQEVVYVSSIFAPDPTSFFKTKFSVSSTLRHVFEGFNEPDLATQLQNWEKWSDYSYSTAFTALSIGSWYPDSLVIEAYNRNIALDAINTPHYFDALKFCATTRGGQELQIHCSTLESQGMVGFVEIRGAFQRLGFDPKDIQAVGKLTDEQLLEAYKTNLAVCNTKTEKTRCREAIDKLARYRNSELIRQYLSTEPLFDLQDAYDTLETSPTVDDDVLITAYQLKAEDSGYYDPAYSRALYTIALHRKSMMLMGYIDDNLPQFGSRNIDLTDAYEIIGVDSYADDATVIRVFQERVQNETYKNFQETWKALKVIGDNRQSKLIEGFLASGVVDSTLLSLDKTPCGLDNIGNTCYLNSLLQYYFAIKPFRELVLRFDEVLTQEKFQENPNYSTRRIGGRVVGYKETERSYQFLYQLRDLYWNMIHMNQRCVTPTKELAYLAFSPISEEIQFEKEPEVQELAPSTADTDMVSIHSSQNLVDIDGDLDMDEAAPKPIESHLELQSEEKLVDLDDISMAPVEKQEEDEKEQALTVPSLAISHEQMENTLEIGRQQDVTECIANVLSQVESALDPDTLDTDNEQLDSVKKMFYGKTKQTLCPMKAEGKPRTKEERFLNLIVNIGDHPKDIYDALDTFFTEDVLELDNEEVKRSLAITELPNILQIQVQRVQFDRVRLMPVKSNEPLPFEETLYMDRYMDTDDPVVVSKREEVFNWRRRIEKLHKDKDLITSKGKHGLSVRESLEATRDFLQSDTMNEAGVLVDENTLDVLSKQIVKIESQLRSIDTEVADLEGKIANQFSGFTKIGYTIFAIFIHRGQASYGHYWIYIRDPKTGLYRKYNDEVVSEVPLEEVMNFSETNTATPYYLAFVKDDLVDEIEPLKREIVEPGTEEGKN